jgi:hypothetical protein
MKIEIETTIKKSIDLLEANLEDSLALMSIEDGKYYGMNPIGKEIWKLIDVPIKTNKIIDQLLIDFSIDSETCQKETIIFLNQLLERKMILIVN